MFPPLIKPLRLLLDILFPPLCIGCKKYIGDVKNVLICQRCLESIKTNNSFFCPVCKLRLPQARQICKHKELKRHPYILAAASNYDNQTLQNLIHYFKYKKLEAIAPILGDLLTKYLNSLSLKPYTLNFSTIIVPIPLHFKRKIERGYNQSELLAQIVSAKFNIPLANALRRTQNNPPQARAKNYVERQKNLSGIFSVSDPEVIKNKNIILIDDVYTSGATIAEASRVLKQNNARKIIALVVAKA